MGSAIPHLGSSRTLRTTTLLPWFKVSPLFRASSCPLSPLLTRLQLIPSPPFFPRSPDRFSQILVPLLQNMATTYHSSPIPDLLSFSPTFWDIYRNSMDDDIAHDVALSRGVKVEEADVRFDPRRAMSAERREWVARRMRDVLGLMAGEWEGEGGRRPTILWRAFYPICELARASDES